MLLSFLLWLSIGGLYDLSLISYALSSTNDNKFTYAKPQLPIGEYVNDERGLELSIKPGNRCILSGRLQGGSFRMPLELVPSERAKSYVCYNDPRRSWASLDSTVRRQGFGIFTQPSLLNGTVTLCHSFEGSVWMKLPQGYENINLTNKTSKRKEHPAQGELTKPVEHSPASARTGAEFHQPLPSHSKSKKRRSQPAEPKSAPSAARILHQHDKSAKLSSPIEGGAERQMDGKMRETSDLENTPKTGIDLLLLAAETLDREDTKKVEGKN